MDTTGCIDQLSYPTIMTYLRRLKGWGAITRINKSGKGAGRGKSIFYALDPFAIPDIVWGARASKATKSRYTHELHNLKFIHLNEAGDYVLYGETILDNSGEQLTDLIETLVQLIGKVLGCDEAKIARIIVELTDTDKLIAGMNEYPFRFDQDFLFWFHVFIVLQWLFTYDEAALS